MKTKNYSNVQFVITAPKIRTTWKDMKILNMRSIQIGIKRTLKYNLIILSEKLMLHIILQGMRYGLLYVESNSFWGVTVVQNFGILDGAADLQVEIWPKFFCQFSAVMWWTFAENFNEISQTVIEQSSIYWKIMVSICLSSVDPPTFSKNLLNLGGWHP